MTHLSDAMRLKEGGSNGFTFLIALAALIFLPSAAKFLLGTSSLAAGLMAACIVIIGMGLAGFYRTEGGHYWQWFSTIIVLTIFAIVLHGTVAALWFVPDLGRSAGSLATLVVMLLAAYPVRTISRATSPKNVDFSITVITALFAVIAAMSIAEIQPKAVDIFGKPIFPFTEPSHFALEFAPFLIYQCKKARPTIKMVWLGVVLLLAYLLQNLTLVIAVVVAAACSLPGLWLLAGFISVGVIAEGLDLTYFTDRLNFGPQTTNLSALVYVQGVELMQAAWSATSGWGIGFQQLGVAPINVPTSDIIYRILQDDANLFDGGFLAAKVVAEFGVIGILLVAGYLWVAVRALIALRYKSGREGTDDPLEIFSLSVIVAFSLEVFVRGAGYFSGTALLFVASLLLASQGRFLRRPHQSESQSCPV